MRRAIIALSTVALVIACKGNVNLRWENTPIGDGEATFDLEIKDTPVEPPANPKKVGEGTAEKSGQKFDILDTNGNGFPDEDDLLRDAKTGRCYPIKSLKRVGGNFTAGPLWLVEPYEKVYVPVPFEWASSSAESYLQGYGIDRIVKDGHATLQTIRGLWMGGWAGVDTPALVGVLYSSRVHWPDMRRYPSLGGELHSLQAPGGELVFVHVLQGTLGDIARFLVDAGLRVYAFRLVEGLWIKNAKGDGRRVQVAVGPSKDGPWTAVASLDY